MMDLFSVLAAEDAEGQANLRKATSVATKRVTEQFGHFLASSSSLEQYLQRYDFAFDDLKNTVTATAQEYGVEPETVLVGVEARFKRQPEPKTASVEHEARRPKLCPYHSEVTDISLAQGEPRAGFDAMAQHAWGAQHCQGAEYEGGRCNFKREMTTQAYWDEKAERAEQRRQEREEQRLQLENEQELPEFGPDNDTPAPEPIAEDGEVFEPGADGAEVTEPVAEEPQAEVPMAMAASSDQDAPLAREANDPWGDPRGQLEQGQPDLCPYCQGQGCAQCGNTGRLSMVKEAPGKEHMPGVGEKRNRQYEHIKESCLASGKSEEECKELAARTVNKQRAEHGETKSNVVEAEARETINIEDDNQGPIPKMDKSKWVPEKLKVVDTEMEGTPHPTRRKDVTEPIIDTNDSDPFEETDAVLEKQDVEKADPVGPGEGGSWSGNKGANPVTSAASPSTNPVAEILLEQDHGFEDESVVQAAIRQAR